MINLFRKFDDHCLTYFFIIGFALGLRGPEEGSSIYCSVATAVIGGLAWYSAKAILITGSTVKNWDRDHPGEPWFKAGGLTQYDQDYADAIGKATADAIRRQSYES